jgi:hypothetical protein
LWGWKVDRTGSESCPMVDFDISGLGPLDSTTTVLIGWLVGQLATNNRDNTIFIMKNLNNIHKKQSNITRVQHVFSPPILALKKGWW